MLDTTKSETILPKLDRAFHLAVTMAWEELRKPVEPRSVRVEYLSEPGVVLDDLRMWSVKAGGYQDLVCDYWTGNSLVHPDGARFGNQHYSGMLAQTLGMIMKNQDQFMRPGDAGCHSLVQIDPPVGDESAQAAAVMSQIASRFGGATGKFEESKSAKQN